MSHAFGGPARSAFIALALASPALALAQTAPPQSTPAETPPVQAVPGVGSAASVLPGATVLPDMMYPGDNSAELGSEPTDLTRYGVAAGIGETDNVNLSATNPKSQTMAAANADFDLRRTGSRLDGIAVGTFTDIDYLQHAFSNQVLGRFDGLLTAKMWSDRLKWAVADDFGEEQTNPFAAVTPVNLQRVNVFSTGPDLTLRPSDASFVKVDARYTRTTYQTSPFDGHNFAGSAEVGEQISPLSALSLVVAAEQLRFDNTLVNTDYERREAYGHYQISGARTTIDAQLGVTQANDTGSWKTTPLARLALSRRVTPFSVVSLDAGREYTDSAGAFSNLRTGAAGGIVIAPVTQTTSNYLRNYGSAGWHFARLRTTIDITGTWERDKHDLQSVFDTTREGVQLKVGRAITPQLTASVTGAYAHYDYFNQGFTDKFGTLGGGLAYQPGRWVIVYARYEHAFRRTAGVATQLIGGNSYDENRVFVMIGYRPHSTNTEPGGAFGSGGG